MGLLDGILGIKDVKKRVDRIDKRLENVEKLIAEEYEPLEEFKVSILECLSDYEPKTTEEMASELKKSRSRVSYVLNQMEKEGSVKEAERRGKELLYVRVE